MYTNSLLLSIAAGLMKLLIRIDPYHARAKVCCGSILRLRNIWLPFGGLKLNVQKPGP